MNKVSNKRARWNAEYRKKKKSDSMVQTCAWCGRRELKTLMDPHHPNGKDTLEDLLDYVYIHREEHEYLHTHGDEAREKGLLGDRIFFVDRNA